MAPAPRTTNAAPQAAAGLPVSSPLRGILFLITSTIVFSVAQERIERRLRESDVRI